MKELKKVENKYLLTKGCLVQWRVQKCISSQRKIEIYIIKIFIQVKGYDDREAFIAREVRFLHQSHERCGAQYLLDLCS